MLALRPVRLLLACAVLLVVGHLFGILLFEVWGVDRRHGPIRQVDLNNEGNFAAWYSTFVLTCCAALALVVGTVKRLRGEGLGSRWVGLAAFLLLMAIDETSQLHDQLNRPLRHGLDLPFGILYFAWLLPALLVLAAAVYYFSPLLGSISPTVRPQLLLGGIIYFSGAVGFEMLSGAVVEHGRDSLIYLSVFTVEEILEMVGGLLTLTALLRQVRELRPDLVVRWTGEAPEVLPADESQPAREA